MALRLPKTSLREEAGAGWDERCRIAAAVHQARVHEIRRTLADLAFHVRHQLASRHLRECVSLLLERLAARVEMLLGLRKLVFDLSVDRAAVLHPLWDFVGDLRVIRLAGVLPSLFLRRAVHLNLWHILILLGPSKTMEGAFWHCRVFSACFSSGVDDLADTRSNLLTVFLRLVLAARTFDLRPAGFWPHPGRGVG